MSSALTKWPVASDPGSFDPRSMEVTSARQRRCRRFEFGKADPFGWASHCIVLR